MNELTYVSAAEAIRMTGLRMAFTRGVPGPWGVAARAIFEHKNIPFVAVAQDAGEPNEDLQRWTGQNSAPVAVLNDERPRALWSEILLLAERLAPEPRLIPADPDERMLTFGLAHEMCAEDGLGWSLRWLLFAAMEAQGAQTFPSLVKKYDSGASVEHAQRRVNAVLDLLARRLSVQQAKGSEFLVGDSLTAADFYWTAFSNLLDAMAEDLCDMPDYYRRLGHLIAPYLDRAVPSNLLEHRDRIARRYIRIPMKF